MRAGWLDGSVGKTASLSLGWSLKSHWVAGESHFSLVTRVAHREGWCVYTRVLLLMESCCVFDRCLCVVLEHLPSVIGVSCIQTPKRLGVSNSHHTLSCRTEESILRVILQFEMNWFLSCILQGKGIVDGCVFSAI